MVKEYFKPASVDEALELLAAQSSFALAGGTFALAFEARDKPERAVDVGGILPRTIVRKGAGLYVGAGATFQELIESPVVPDVLKDAARMMVNRNTRNRATVGGNIGANKSCSSLAPILLALGAAVEYQERGKAPATEPLANWIAEPKGLVISVLAPLEAGIQAAALRVSRTACDVATATVACAYRLNGGMITGLKLAVGGFSAHAQQRQDIAALFEGKALPAKNDAEQAVRDLLVARDDQRGSADYKKLRGAALIADALHSAKDIV
ncbi:MAG: FAD binding domain-containing protein [Spirochaetales bacterium]|nr:FAD binding domain-containing protein [Spirochaetales bacterium]